MNINKLKSNKFVLLSGVFFAFSFSEPTHAIPRIAALSSRVTSCFKSTSPFVLQQIPLYVSVASASRWHSSSHRLNFTTHTPSINVEREAQKHFVSAIKAADFESVKKYIALGVDVNKTVDGYLTPLSYLYTITQHEENFTDYLKISDLLIANQAMTSGEILIAEGRLSGNTTD